MKFTLTAIITFSSLLSSWAIYMTYVKMRFPLSLSLSSLATILIELPANSLILFFQNQSITSKLLDFSNSYKAFTTFYLMSS